MRATTQSTNTKATQICVPNIQKTETRIAQGTKPQCIERRTKERELRQWVITRSWKKGITRLWEEAHDKK